MQTLFSPLSQTAEVGPSKPNQPAQSVVPAEGSESFAMVFDETQKQHLETPAESPTPSVPEPLPTNAEAPPAALFIQASIQSLLLNLGPVTDPVGPTSEAVADSQMAPITESPSDAAETPALPDGQIPVPSSAEAFPKPAETTNTPQAAQAADSPAPLQVAEQPPFPASSETTQTAPEQSSEQPNEQSSEQSSAPTGPGAPPAVQTQTAPQGAVSTESPLPVLEPNKPIQAEQSQSESPSETEAETEAETENEPKTQVFWGPPRPKQAPIALAQTKETHSAISPMPTPQLVRETDLSPDLNALTDQDPLQSPLPHSGLENLQPSHVPATPTTESAAVQMPLLQMSAPAESTQVSKELTAPAETSPKPTTEAENLRFAPLGERIRLLRQTGQNQMRLNLQPAELGRVSLQIVQKEQELHLHIFTDTVLAKELLESQIGQLKQALSQQGLNLQQCQIEVNPEQSGQDFSQERPSQHPTQQSAKTGQSDWDDAEFELNLSDLQHPQPDANRVNYLA
ncbi:MAG: flagellar hook-length control protein FliK [Candidatus Sericytochromatia bacterium]